MKKITSCDNALIKELSFLTNKSSERRKRKVVFFEGVHLAEQCFSQKLDIKYFIVREDSIEKKEISDLCVKFHSNKVECIIVSPAVFAKITNLTHGGDVLVVASYTKLMVLEDEIPLESIVLLDSIQDPGNLGTILRTVAASGIKYVFISSGSVDVWSPKVVRAGMGAHLSLNIYDQADLSLILTKFKGKKIVTSLDAAISLYDIDLTGACAFVFGNEGSGVSPHLISLVNSTVIIPMLGKTESLNVSSSVAICLFERVRQSQRYITYLNC